MAGGSVDVRELLRISCARALFTFFAGRVTGLLTGEVESSSVSPGFPSCNAVESSGRAHDIGRTAQISKAFK